MSSIGQDGREGLGVANPAAFPCSPGDVPFWNEGMSLRDWFAGQVLTWPDTGGLSPHEAAEYAYSYADAMLAARAQS